LNLSPISVSFVHAEKKNPTENTLLFLMVVPFFVQGKAKKGGISSGGAAKVTPEGVVVRVMQTWGYFLQRNCPQ